MKKMSAAELVLRQAHALTFAIGARQAAKSAWMSTDDAKARKVAFEAWTLTCKVQSMLEKIYFSK